MGWKVLAEAGAEHSEQGDVQTSPGVTPSPLPASPGPAMCQREPVSKTQGKLSITSVRPSLWDSTPGKWQVSPTAPGLIKAFCKKEVQKLHQTSFKVLWRAWPTIMVMGWS